MTALHNGQSPQNALPHRLSYRLSASSPTNHTTDSEHHHDQHPSIGTLHIITALSVNLHSTIAKIVQRCLLRSEHGFEKAEARHKAKMDIGEEKQMTDMATSRLQKARLKLTKCGAGGENASEDYFHDSDEGEETQRQVVKERLMKEKDILMMETDAENGKERRQKAEKSAQKLCKTLSSLQTEHSRLLNSHNIVILSHLPSQPNAVTNKGLLHDFAKLWTTAAAQTARDQNSRCSDAG
ncbi:hypothetical protein BLNAU_824 [Blattamonas nauphoetae]|uniref:Uncharacterized protein n=1 Tax=Blattamonas nauphoetae TaxID=2049346 RepID=A0ABQ9YKK3_9EUKA|nr:hypothetical protein BLNAU_824 [Blattamonas nauphoetae]